ncbi:MAG TPA: DUF4384 domain-containing protein [Gemmatimonadales bacterium]|nr:DUF4384 domain-containing protein [Gemmatimonadales bacterium]
MISAFWLPLILGVAPAPAPAAALQPAASAARAGDEDPTIRVWLNEDGRFQRGDEAKVYVRTRDDGYLLVLHVDPDNRLRVLFPLDPGDDNFIRGGKKYQILGRGDRESFEIDVRSGRGTVYAAVSRDPFRFDGFVAGDHWDFRALNDVPLTRDVEADLNDLVRRLAAGDFDYDLTDYDIYERIYAGGGYTTAYYAPAYYHSWYDPYSFSCFGYWACGGSYISIGIAFGDPWWYRPYYHRPYYPYRPSRFYYWPGYYHPCCGHPAYYPYPGYHRPYPPRGFYYPDGYPYRRRPYTGGTYYAGGYYFGGHYAAPWRDRVNDQFYAGSYAWRGREFTTDRGPPLAGESSPRRRGEAGAARGTVPAPNMTPVRTEGRRPAVAVGDPGRAPEARRSPERREPGSGKPLPVRVGAGSNEPRRAADQPRRSSEEPRRSSEEPRRGVGEPRRIAEARPSEPRIEAPRAQRAEPARGRESPGRDLGDERRGYEGPRIIQPRGDEGEREARRPAPEPSRAREAPDYRAPRSEPAPRAEPRREPRSEPRPAPRAEPRREAPAPSVDRGRSEPRSAPPARGGGGQGSGRRRN